MAAVYSAVSPLVGAVVTSAVSSPELKRTILIMSIVDVRIVHPASAAEIMCMAVGMPRARLEVVAIIHCYGQVVAHRPYF